MTELVMMFAKDPFVIGGVVFLFVFFLINKLV